MYHEKSCGAIVYRIDGSCVLFLLIRHVKGKHWAFPKGHVEKDETEVQTALREIKEETGLEVDLDDKFRETVCYAVNKYTDKEVVYFIARTKKDDGSFKLQQEELLEAKWVDFDTAYKSVTFDNDRMLLVKAKVYFKKNNVKL